MLKKTTTFEHPLRVGIDYNLLFDPIRDWRRQQKRPERATLAEGAVALLDKLGKHFTLDCLYFEGQHGDFRRYYFGYRLFKMRPIPIRSNAELLSYVITSNVQMVYLGPDFEPRNRKPKITCSVATHLGSYDRLYASLNNTS